jgi:hypothetical protein
MRIRRQGERERGSRSLLGHRHPRAGDVAAKHALHLAGGTSQVVVEGDQLRRLGAPDVVLLMRPPQVLSRSAARENLSVSQAYHRPVQKSIKHTHTIDNSDVAKD